MNQGTDQRSHRDAGQSTRAGNFRTDANGNVVDNNGTNLQGYSVEESGNVKTGVLTNLRVDTSNMPPKATGLINIASNLDSTKEATGPQGQDQVEAEFPSLCSSTAKCIMAF
ncbi:hypothetical protein [Pseudomonas syringae]|uniref:hypothetical protein n=1 Tax=Pseudomonas syringae TaxID=317 RepID=UPI0011AF8C34|nr:hypothetical protein [Pseudomonas syringae]MCF5732953.1 hypothetical protein [Pseudomonas syringae]MCF5738828.1 hypothetical protein [Pseudomonas syringae]MCF5751833.1 hypothetical protein [Pseudomonas syringae]MCF5757848.1 hypothetical protein [Pseudomonas syringae]MDF5830540.1 hypothetical protein [Pseudomonas syringae]